MSGRDLSDMDKIAWQAATRHVRPLAGRRGGQLGRAKTVAAADEAVAVRVSGPVKAAVSKPQNRENEKTVRRGRQVVDASFDLHGHTQSTAWRLLPQFLAREQARGARCVIVITGKGASGDGVLRRNFLHWMEMPEARHLVSGFAPAHAKHGGGGAWYVFLRRA